MTNDLQAPLVVAGRMFVGGGTLDGHPSLGFGVPPGMGCVGPLVGGAVSVPAVGSSLGAVDGMCVVDSLGGSALGLVAFPVMACWKTSASHDRVSIFCALMGTSGAAGWSCLAY